MLISELLASRVDLRIVLFRTIVVNMIRYQYQYSQSPHITLSMAQYLHTRLHSQTPTLSKA